MSGLEHGITRELTMSETNTVERPVKPLYGAWWCSNRSHYDDGGSDSSEHLIDADVSLETLRGRVNAYLASPKFLQGHRGQKLRIAKQSMISNEYWSNGGGCDYTAKIALRELPQLASV
jgi:hypothetical protein